MGDITEGFDSHVSPYVVNDQKSRIITSGPHYNIIVVLGEALPRSVTGLKAPE